MQAQARKGERWHFSTGVLAPVIIALVVTVCGVLFFVLWATGNSDARSLQRQTRLAAHVIEETVEAAPRAQESVVVGDEAFANTYVKFNRSWVERHLGLWMHSYFGHDRAFLLNEENVPVYSMNHGANASPILYAADADMFGPLVAKMREKIAAGELDDYRLGRVAKAPRVVELTTIAQLPAIVSIMPIVSDMPRRIYRPGSEFLHVTVVFLDAELARELSHTFMLSDASFSIEQSGDTGRAVFPIMNSTGRFVAFLEWLQDRPGARLLNEMVPVLVVGFLIAGTLVFLLLDKLWRSSDALERGRRQAEFSALHDALTGLPNRTLFDRELADAVEGLTRQHRPVTLLMLDLDRFKQVNDTRGHLAGDALIRAVAQRLATRLVPPSSLARIGGDEFAVICKACPDAAAADALAQELIDCISRPYLVDGSEVFIGASIGIVQCRDPSVDRIDLVRKADIALYEAKAGGRNRSVTYRDEMNEELQQQHVIEAALREALRRGDELSVVFQPLYGAANGAITGAEALSRWKHPELGAISPSHFIAVAESCGLIEALGDLVLDRACRLGAVWPGQTIAVNISPTQLRNPEFSKRLFALLEASGMRPEDLELEITEGILLEDEMAVTETLRNLRGAGIKIALDDFGTGYSSLNYLKRYAVDRIKIDRSFVSQLAEGGVSAAIVQAMITLAHAMGIKVTAEGVETEQQRAALAAMGCNTCQGYLFSPAVSADALEALFSGAGHRRRGLRSQVA